MNLLELDKIVGQYMIVKKVSPEEWQILQRPSAQAAGPENFTVVATKKTRALALEVIAENPCAAVEQTRKNNYKLIFTCPREDYIRGLVTGSLFASQLLEISLKNPRDFDLCATRAQYIQILQSGGEDSTYGESSENLSRKIIGADQFNSAYDIIDSDSYPWRLLSEFSKSIGIVKKNKYCEEKKLDLYDSRVYGPYIPLETPPPSDIRTCKEKLYYEQNCNLIVEELSNGKYKIIHCDLAKNYFRGLVNAYKILEPLTENSEGVANLRTEIIKNLFRKEINTARREAGYPALAYEQELHLGMVFPTKKPLESARNKGKNSAGRTTTDNSRSAG